MDGLSPPLGGTFLLRRANVVHPEPGEVAEAMDVLVLDGKIADVGRALRVPSGIQDWNLKGLFVFPGLIDAHVHVTAVRHDLRESAQLPRSYVAAAAVGALQSMLGRGFTTVRDVGGADWGLSQAAEDGLIGLVPRLIYCGAALSQSGGHGDMRGRDGGSNPCCSIGIVCDGVDEVRRAVRGQIASGAKHIKLMLGGGVASDLDNLTGFQFSDDELLVAVAEAAAAGVYVTGHAYTSAQIDRAIDLGVRCIEHGNLLTAETAAAMARNDTFYVPTLITYDDLADLVAKGDAPRHVMNKIEEVRGAGLNALRLAQAAGVRIVFGTDLLAGGMRRQLEEFRLRSAVQSPLELLRSATTTAAGLLNSGDVLGAVKPGYLADLVIADLNPLEEPLHLLASRSRSVMKGGVPNSPIPVARSAQQLFTA